MPENITIDNEEVMRNLGKVADGGLKNNLRECLEKACLKVVADSKTNCPVDTGELRNSIQFQIEDENENLAGYVGSSLEYAPYVHQGTGIYALEGNGRKEVPWVFYSVKDGKYYSTSGIHPTPFLQNAIDANRQAILDYFNNVLGGITL